MLLLMKRGGKAESQQQKATERASQMASRFWRQAEYDLAVARTLIKPGTAYVAANLAHQAAEKALKAGC
jgi:DNA-binding FadR family transcriptional regulator